MSQERTAQIIEQKLATLEPQFLQIDNESHMHSVPPGSESHFKVVIVAASFDGQGAVARHRAVNKILAADIDAGIHALSIQAFAPEQWQAKGGQVAASPKCAGGSKKSKPSCGNIAGNTWGSSRSNWMLI